MDLESGARELKMLAGRERLSSLELDRAKSLMVELKQQGMLNPEIVELTGGRWSESTVKGYTKGVRATDPDPYKSTAALFSEMLSRNLTLAEVSQAMTITTELEGMGSSLSDMVGFMQQLEQKEIGLDQLAEAVNLNAELDGIGTSPSELARFVQELEKENINTPSFVLLFHDWHEGGLTPVDAQSALSYKTQLEDAGFDMETLSQITEAAGKFGSPAEVLEAVAKYASLLELDEEAKTKRAELDKELKTKRAELETLAVEMESRSQELDAAGERLDSLQKETVAREKTLATYKRLEAMGFNEKALSQLTKVADKYGGPRKVLTALNSFGDLSEIKTATEETQGKKKQQGAILKDLEERHSHLKSAIEMCQKLMQDHKFGLNTITSLLATAKMYGEPIQVLKALEAYGKREAIDEEARQGEARVEMLKKTQSQYETRIKSNLDQFEALNAKAIEVGRTVGSVQEQIKKDTAARDILNLLQKPTSAGYEEYLPLALVVLNSVSVWANMNKGRFTYFSLLDRNLKEAMGNIGGI